LLQSVSYIAGALGVCVAAFYYVMNLRISQRNQELSLETRQISLIDSIATRIINKEGYRDTFDLLNYEWKNYEDFEKKYGTENDTDAAAKRYATMAKYNQLGMMLRRGLVEAEDLYSVGMGGVIFLWMKYKPILEEGRRRYFGKGYFEDLEYLAGEMVRITKEKDPSFVVPETMDKYVPGK